jgi:hypothetical protein
MTGMSAPAAASLMIAIPCIGLVLFALAFFVLGRRVRALRRQGRITYPAKTSSDSNANFTSSAM